MIEVGSFMVGMVFGLGCMVFFALCVGIADVWRTKQRLIEKEDILDEMLEIERSKQDDRPEQSEM